MDKICKLEYINWVDILRKLDKSKSIEILSDIISKIILYELFSKSLLNIYDNIIVEVTKADKFKYDSSLIIIIGDTNFYSRPPLPSDTLFIKGLKRVETINIKCEPEVAIYLEEQKQLLIDLSIDRANISRFLYKKSYTSKNITSLSPILEIIPKELLTSTHINNILNHINYKEMISKNPFATKTKEYNLIKEKLLLNKLIG